MKQKMPAPVKGRSTNPPPTAGAPKPITNNSTTSDAKQNGKFSFTKHDPARGTHKNGDFSS